MSRAKAATYTISGITVLTFISVLAIVLSMKKQKVEAFKPLDIFEFHAAGNDSGPIAINYKSDPLQIGTIDDKEIAVDARLVEELAYAAEKAGYYDSGKISDYQSYPDAALAEMSKAGDGAAAMERLNRAMAKAGPMDKETWGLAVDAAANGQTAALLTMSMHWQLQGDFSTPQTSKRSINTALAFAYTAKLMGDPSPLQFGLYAYASHNIEPSDQDFAAVINKGKEFLAELEADRAKRGLGPIDKEAIRRAVDPYKVDNENLIGAIGNRFSQFELAAH